MSLWHISTELEGLLLRADRHGIDSDEVDEAIGEHTQALVEAFDEKADDYAALIRACEARCNARVQEARRLLALSENDQLLAKRLKERLLSAMQRVGRDRISTTRADISIRRNGGAVPLVIEDEDAIPSEFRVPRTTITLDREALRNALDSGRQVSGVRLGERGVHLHLR